MTGVDIPLDGRLNSSSRIATPDPSRRNLSPCMPMIWPRRRVDETFPSTRIDHEYIHSKWVSSGILEGRTVKSRVNIELMTCLEQRSGVNEHSDPEVSECEQVWNLHPHPSLGSSWPSPSSGASSSLAWNPSIRRPARHRGSGRGGLGCNGRNACWWPTR